MTAAPADRTDWDRYYTKPFAATKVTRKITEAALVRLIRRFTQSAGRGIELVELGGANSCFFDRIAREFSPRASHVVDFNQLGLDKMRARLGERADVHYYRQDVLDLTLDRQADLVFSIGLIEHFDPAQTARAVAAHFRLLRPGGACIISFPTPTWLYRATRALAEVTNKWEFPDERPLRIPEVAAAIVPHGSLLHHEIVWPIFLTQMFIVARKRQAP
jgi:SAM-dependent methyltransferase